MRNFKLSTIHGKDVVIDITKLISDEVIYVNATKLAKQFGKNKQRLNEFFKTKGYLEYENAISKVTEKHDFKTDYKGLRYSKKGKYGGTYLHSDLVIVFLRWLNVDFAVQCDMYIKNIIQEIHNDKIISNATAQANKENTDWIQAREKATDTRNKLTDVIKEFCQYAQQQRGSFYKDGRCPYYAKLTSLVYKVLGIKKPKGTRTIRDVFSGAVVQKIEYLEDMLIELLKSHIQQETEYHEAFKITHEIIKYKVSLLDETVLVLEDKPYADESKGSY